MTRNRPTVSVVMPVHNGAAYVASAVKSVLSQTMGDFELLIVDDHSTDATVEIISGLADDRINLVQNTGPKGFSHSLNLGIHLGKGQYIARMDADDESLPTRLAKQTIFLDRHPDIAFVGGLIAINDPQTGLRVDRTIRPTLPGHIRWSLLFYCSMAHPTILMRRSAFESLGGYDGQFFPAEDYHLWLRAIDKGFRFANVDEVVLKYRVNPEGMSHSPTSEQEDVAVALSQKALESLLGNTIDAEILRAIKNPTFIDLQHARETSASTRQLLITSVQAVQKDSLRKPEDVAIRRHARSMWGRVAWHTLARKPSLAWQMKGHSAETVKAAAAYALGSTARRIRSKGQRRTERRNLA